MITWPARLPPPRRDGVPRFHLYRNLNPKASHGLYLDVQSDLVTTATRWCVPLYLAAEGNPLMTCAQWLVSVEGRHWVVDTPNMLAVPKGLLRDERGCLEADDRFRLEAALDFMLRGY